MSETKIRIHRVIAPYFATNCWIFGNSEYCVLVDPGIGNPYIVSEITKLLKQNKIRIGAVLITHGHIDHTFSLVPLAKELETPEILIHTSDRDLLVHPERALSDSSQGLFRDMKLRFPDHKFIEPTGVRSFSSDFSLSIAGMNFEITNTPGHTPGSIIAKVDDQILVTGDTLFAGSIGRTDLPRGSISDMEGSLREKIWPMSGDLLLLPGHGDTSRLEWEFETNPYLIAAKEGRLAQL